MHGLCHGTNVYCDNNCFEFLWICVLISFIQPKKSVWIFLAHCHSIVLCFNQARPSHIQYEVSNLATLIKDLHFIDGLRLFWYFCMELYWYFCRIFFAANTFVPQSFSDSIHLFLESGFPCSRHNIHRLSWFISSLWIIMLGRNISYLSQVQQFLHSCPNPASTIIIPPATKLGGVYWIQPVCLSVCLSVCPLTFSCPPCSIYSSRWILSIFGTNDQ